MAYLINMTEKFANVRGKRLKVTKSLEIKNSTLVCLDINIFLSKQTTVEINKGIKFALLEVLPSK